MEPFRTDSPGPSRSGRRTRRIFGIATAGQLLLHIGLVVLNRSTVVFWLETHRCPAGPMDRPEVDCSVLEMLQITALGGWLAGLVVIATITWWLLWVAVFLATRQHHHAVGHAQAASRRL